MRISDWSSDVCSSDLIALAGMAFTRHPVPFLGAAFMIGLTSVGAQLLVPFAAHLAPDHRRGRIIGNIMSGLMLGILLARRSEEHTSELQSLMRISYAVFCLKKKKNIQVRNRGLYNSRIYSTKTIH